MHRRTYAIGAAALAATSALGAGVINGASANRGGSPGTAAAPPGAPPGGGPPGYFTHRVGPGGPGRRALDADLFAVMRDVHAAIAAKAPDLAKPIIDKAVSDGDISSAQGDRLTKVVDDKRLTRADAEALFSDAKVAPVFFSIKAAIAREAPGLAKPIVDKAVDDKKITRAEGDRLIVASAWRAEGLGLGGGPMERHRGFRKRVP